LLEETKEIDINKDMGIRKINMNNNNINNITYGSPV